MDRQISQSSSPPSYRAPALPTLRNKRFRLNIPRFLRKRFSRSRQQSTSPSDGSGLIFSNPMVVNQNFEYNDISDSGTDESFFTARSVQSTRRPSIESFASCDSGESFASAQTSPSNHQIRPPSQVGSDDSFVTALSGSSNEYAEIDDTSFPSWGTTWSSDESQAGYDPQSPIGMKNIYDEAVGREEPSPLRKLSRLLKWPFRRRSTPYKLARQQQYIEPAPDISSAYGRLRETEGENEFHRRPLPPIPVKKRFFPFRKKVSPPKSQQQPARFQEHIYEEVFPQQYSYPPGSRSSEQRIPPDSQRLFVQRGPLQGFFTLPAKYFHRPNERRQNNADSLWVAPTAEQSYGEEEHIYDEVAPDERF